MEHYRCFLMDAAGKFINSVELKAASDEEAYTEARIACRQDPMYVGFELWQLDRMVASRPNLLNARQE